ncbi:hypothetical protein PG990_005056 [Apiospora arundinis]
MSNKQGKMAGYINYRMRVTLMDGRQMTGQMLAFDKVPILHSRTMLSRKPTNGTSAAYEPRSCRHRRIPTRQAKAEQARSPWRIRLSNTDHRVRREAHAWPDHCARCPDCLIVGRVRTPADPSTRLGKTAATSLPTALTSGPGVARPAGRGAAPTSLAGPAAGVGGGAPAFPPQFPGAPGFGPGRGGPPAPGFPPGGFPPAGFPPNTGFQPPPGFPGGAGAPPPGFNPLDDDNCETGSWLLQIVELVLY